jgi:hypothetical protein
MVAEGIQKQDAHKIFGHTQEEVIEDRKTA